MTDYWTSPSDIRPKLEPTPAEFDTIEAVLDAADAWNAGELPTAEALALVLAEPKAIGTAFRFAWHDPRRPALERLHMLEYGQRYDLVRTDFGYLDRATFEMTERNAQWRKTAGIPDDQWDAA